ncbi:protein of unknown function [Xenorhabdus poinarii G6]|uniref:Uncharacterized protein n=1 Tax=Xenorhabdus poinarii G6 TaxID=1354304 RepID=A0A068R6C7_9GAMM|nr:hypothetical protein [Xenorhabdus poinarii]CDG22723.1 protein of unknown function [Xenorhabdus poinarii G6]
MSVLEQQCQAVNTAREAARTPAASRKRTRYHDQKTGGLRKIRRIIVAQTVDPSSKTQVIAALLAQNFNLSGRHPDKMLFIGCRLFP